MASRCSFLLNALTFTPQYLISPYPASPSLAYAVLSFDLYTIDRMVHELSRVSSQKTWTLNVISHEDPHSAALLLSISGE